MNREPLLPAWLRDLKLRYLSGEASMFLVHGNVRDVYPWEGPDGRTTYLPLRQLLDQFFGRSKDVVVYYNLSEGVEHPDKVTEKRFTTALNARLALKGEVWDGELPRRPSEILPLLEELVMDAGLRMSLVIDYAEMVVPNGDLSFMGDTDKGNLVTLQRWSNDPALLQSDNIIVLVAENLADVNRRLVSSATLAAVSVSLPDQEERLAFIQATDRRGITVEMDDLGLSKITAGLSLVQIRGLFRRARQAAEPITYRSVSARKKNIIEQECHGLVEFVSPNHDFSHVGGQSRLKEDLLRVATAIKKGQANRVPMGIIFVGPMGTGKTFIAEAFAAESGLTCLKFKNFREKWVGSTEGNLEKILQVVDGLGYVLLILDEADRSMGSSSDGDGGTSSRVIARLKEFMSDTSHRGRVVILMMKNRPDKLDTDLKRPGRFDLKIPFFFPESVEERQNVMLAVLRKAKVRFDPAADLGPAAVATDGYSAAELEAVVLAAVGRANDADRDVVAGEDIAAAVSDVIPSRDTRMLEFMEMLAVFESSSRRMLPERFQAMRTDEVHARLDVLRAALGHRV
jgi:AAA+ superfamily predicted ATPase